MRFYSQHGEDSVLWKLFKHEDHGFYMEVGSMDGLRNSNTYVFELKGWDGICVEAHPAYAKLNKKNRPKSTVIHAAVSDKDGGNVEFFASPWGATSTLREDFAHKLAARHKHTDFKQYKRMKVPVRTIASILEEHNVDKVDILSIDIEGTEMEALRGIDYSKCKPRVLIIERNFVSDVDEFQRFMKKQGYHFARKISINHFYCRDPKDVKIIANAARAKTKLTPLPFGLKI